MDIRNRMNDVTALRCHVCQDFLRLVLVPGWKDKLYQKAKHAVENNSHRENYIEPYNKMRSMSSEAYNVDCMDVSFITVIVLFCSDIAPVEKSVRDAIKKLSGDRNTAGHSSENESTEELYCRALLAISDIISFIQTVDHPESSIPDTDRLTFRNKWLKEAEKLQNLLDCERIEYVQIKKEIFQDIMAIKASEDVLATWCNVFGKYNKHYFNTERYNQFVVSASDEGIAFAHTYAAAYFAHERNFDEFFRRINLLCSPNIHLTREEVSAILNELNHYLWLENKETGPFKGTIDFLSQNGFDIYKNQGGYYSLRK